MSYGPPTKTRYGDQDFIKEDWTPQSDGQQSTPPLPPSPVQTTRPSDPFRSNTPGAYQNYQQQYGPPRGNEGQMPPVSAASKILDTKSLTQDDILFLRSWRQDSFFYRVVPITTLGYAGLYFYNKRNNLPMKVSRFFIVSLVGYFIGKMSYRGELLRRLESSPLNTPYMQAMRTALGVKPLAQSGFVSETSSDFTYGGAGFSDIGAQPHPAPLAPSADFGNFNQSYRDPSSFQPSQDFNSFNNDGPLTADANKPSTSYEELRARNRGHLSK